VVSKFCFSGKPAKRQASLLKRLLFAGFKNYRAAHPPENATAFKCVYKGQIFNAYQTIVRA
jgi:hypothetical protein